jgi:prepilin-type N-terminal cleavage/methylation domain-containing protein
MPRAARPGFTLLEVLLSTAIGVLLMGAMYTAMSMQLRHAHAGREVVERSMLIRSLFTRLGNDITNCLAPPLPASSSAASGGSSGSSAGAAAGAATSASSTTTSGTTATASNVVVINLGIQGESGQLTVFVSRVPRELNAAALDTQAPACDLRRITYWLAQGESAGLCRQEYKPVTSADATAEIPPNVSDEASCLMAEEVKSLQFQYFDGTAWQDTWDSTAPGADGVTPMGPPQAVSVLIGVTTRGQELKNYRHVVVIPTANGTTQAAPTPTTGATPSATGN